MPDAYCRYCGARCVVDRIVPDTAVDPAAIGSEPAAVPVGQRVQEHL